MQYHSFRPNIVFTILLAIFMVSSLNACGDANNVSGPAAPALPGPLEILTNSPLPSGTNGMPYDITLAHGGGTPPYTWSLAPGSPALPNGLVLTPSNGNISGAPTDTGTRSTVFKLQDSEGQSVQKTLSITVNIAPAPLAILTPSPLPPGLIGQPYAFALSPTGGTSPFTWNLSSGSLPAGLNLSRSGLISGTPQATGTSSPIFQLEDSGVPQATVTKLLSITINIPAPPRITTTSLPAGTFNAAYNQTVSVTGGTGTLVWGVTSGALPPGLKINASSGNISGTPTNTGSFSFALRVTDQIPQFDEQDLTITINPPAPPTISAPASLPTGTVGQTYPDILLTASGGTAPLTWDPVVSPALPNGLSWDASTQIISGIPLNGSQGTKDHTFTVRDSTNPVLTGTRTYSLTIVLPAPPKITTTSLPNGTVGATYSEQIQSTGGIGTLRWKIIKGSLPRGLDINQATGEIFGKPTRAGLSTFTVQVTDTIPQSDTQNFLIEISISP
jgi:hypothetical protein